MENSVFGSSMSTNVHTIFSRNLHHSGGIEDLRSVALTCSDLKVFNTFRSPSRLQFLRHYRRLTSTYRHFDLRFPKFSSSPPRVACETFDSSVGFVNVINRQQKVFTKFFADQAIKAVVILSHWLCVPAALAALETSGAGGGGGGHILSSGWMGFVAGCLHTLSGPDHLAALAPLSIGRTHMESVAVGALWGCGHDAGQLIFGLLFLLVKDRLKIEVIRTWGARVVGLTLVVIGGMGIREASEGLRRPRGGVPPEKNLVENGSSGLEPRKRRIGFATFATGIVHGLQPDSLLIILPALALPSRWDGAVFLITFLLGTVVAMGGYTLLLTSCSSALKERVPKIAEKMTWASSLLAVALGLAIFAGPIFGFGLY